jgi:hypothetical protein
LRFASRSVEGEREREREREKEKEKERLLLRQECATFVEVSSIYCREIDAARFQILTKVEHGESRYIETIRFSIQSMYLFSLSLTYTHTHTLSLSLSLFV